MRDGKCTHITWDEGTEIKESFLRACSPVHYSSIERHMVVNRQISDIQAVAEKTQQKGLAMTPGEFR